MIESLGNLALSVTILIAVSSVFASIAGIRFQSQKWTMASRWSFALMALLFTIASVALLTAIVQNEFRFEYVASYSERALPLGYKIAAFWAGQQGSLLLWGWILSIICLIATLGFRDWRGIDHNVTIAVLAVSCGFFAALILFAANPFVIIEAFLIPADGRGLNPQLQDPAMIAHPPLLFMGYAGFTVPFAIMIGVLVAGRNDNHWLVRIRRWLLVSWIFLTAGIVLGAWWAYIELGWGGYWAWDPVENASLLPWLTSTALIHSIMVQRQRGMFKWWNINLIAMTFVLCIFGTYITRSGVIDSVHAFGESSIGNFFLAYMGVCVVGVAALMIWRRNALKPERALEGIITREGAFLASNIILLVMMLITLIGTIFPLISGLFINGPVVVKAPFYNSVVVPMAIVLVFIMAHGPVLEYGKTAGKKIAHAMILPGVLAFVVALGVIGFMWEAWVDSMSAFFTSETFTPELQNTFFNAVISAVIAFIAALGSGAVIVGILRSAKARCRSTGENWLIASIRLIDKDHRRYGGQLAHLGLMLVVIGVTGSSLFQTENIYQLKSGESVVIGSNILTLVSLAERYEANYGAVEAVVTLTDRSGSSNTLRPQRRFYNGWEDQPSSQIAVRTTWREDVYLTLVGWEQSGEITAIQVVINPLVLWIWIGGIVTVIGGILCCMPQLLPNTHYVRAASGNKYTDSREPMGRIIPSLIAGDMQ